MEHSCDQFEHEAALSNFSTAEQWVIEHVEWPSGDPIADEIIRRYLDIRSEGPIVDSRVLRQALSAIHDEVEKIWRRDTVTDDSDRESIDLISSIARYCHDVRAESEK